MTGFNDLEFDVHPGHGIGIQATKYFSNGYGVSVIKSPHSYGGEDGLYELAILKGDKRFSGICYDTPIADDVMGYLAEDDVSRLVAEVEALPPVSA